MSCYLPSSTASVSYGKPFTGATPDELKKYIQSLWDDEFVFFPNYDEENEWDVYLLYKSLLGHYSILFLLPGHTEGFFIHLLVDNTRRQTRFVLNYVKLSKFKSNLKALSLGTTEPFTAAHIITKAHDILVDMGSYHALSNNCQDYCKQIANSIGVSSRFNNWKDAVFADIFDGKIVLTPFVVSSAIVDELSPSTLPSHVGPGRDSSLIMTIHDLYE
uniref:Uncharacterized protein n=1 Tax=Amphimedon queenslandica TaxID=400682 RepID=A0A1X7TBG0_AMPQE